MRENPENPQKNWEIARMAVEEVYPPKMVTSLTIEYLKLPG